MPALSVEFEVYCSCGAGLCRNVTVEDRHGSPRLAVEPCAKCLERAETKARESGYDEGYKSGYDTGLDDGRAGE